MSEIKTWLQAKGNYSSGLDILKRCSYGKEHWKSLENNKNSEFLKYLLKQAFNKGITPVKAVAKPEVKFIPAEQPKNEVKTISKKVIAKKSALEQKKSPLSTSESSKKKKESSLKNICSYMHDSVLRMKVLPWLRSTTASLKYGTKKLIQGGRLLMHTRLKELFLRS